MALKPESTKDEPQRAKRSRRSTEEIVDRLVSAAIEEFEAKSFTGATTAAIARRAGVAEALLFNHFGSKAQLFQDAIFKPLEQHFDTFQATVTVDLENAEDLRAGSRQYVDALVDFVSDHKGMFLALVFAQTFKPNGIEGLAEIKGLHDYFARMAEDASRNLKGKGRISPRHMARISFAAIMANVLFGDWLFAEDVDDPEEVRRGIGDFIMDGLGANVAED
jgi:AcrR family transcriptional regulator